MTDGAVSQICTSMRRRQPWIDKHNTNTSTDTQRKLWIRCNCTCESFLWYHCIKEICVMWKLLQTEFRLNLLSYAFQPFVAHCFGCRARTVYSGSWLLAGQKRIKLIPCFVHLVDTKTEILKKRNSYIIIHTYSVVSSSTTEWMEAPLWPLLAITMRERKKLKDAQIIMIIPL